MKPTVVIASHGRISITRQNIESLLQQSVVPNIILVVSLPSEQRMYQQDYPSITIGCRSNYPLGLKWQSGIEIAKHEFPGGPIIINGSDDILGVDFVKNASHMVEEFDFVGLFQWFCWHQNHLYKFDYNAKVPLGGGRIYSAELLKRLDYKIFDVRLNRHLDDFGYLSAIRSIGSSRQWLFVEDVEAYGLNLVSVKGQWAMMNEFSKLLKSPNCSLLQKEKGSVKLESLIGFKPTL